MVGTGFSEVVTSELKKKNRRGDGIEANKESFNEGISWSNVEKLCIIKTVSVDFVSSSSRVVEARNV